MNRAFDSHSQRAAEPAARRRAPRLVRLGLIVLVALGLAFSTACPGSSQKKQQNKAKVEPKKKPPAKAEQKPPKRKKPKHASHPHAHGAHPHGTSEHHHHPHPHPHLEGPDGHHHPY